MEGWSIRSHDASVNARQLRSLARYIRAAADAFGLKDWAVVLHDEPCDNPDHAATVSCLYERRIAHIHVAANFAEMAPVEQRHVIAHELAHIHMDADFNYLSELLPGMVGPLAWTPIEATIRLLHEQGIDGVATGMETRLPLWDQP